MDNFKVIVFIMAILISLMAVADKRTLPYPILLMAAGLIIGFIPVLPDLALDPDVVFLIILPPLLYDAASKTSWHEFRTSIRPISTLAITLVFFTTFAVAAAAYYLIPGFTWPLAFILGAIVSPPDAVAATGIIKGLGLNKQVITILEGESLVNDASALIAYRYAVAAVTTGSFVLWKAGLQFLFVAGAGILVGVVIGYLFVLAHKKIQNNSVVETSLTLLSPFVSYLAAEELHVSGILAVVSAGLIISWRSPEVFSFQTRMRTRVVWDTLVFLLHGFVFILIGLQVPSIIRGLGNYPFLEILGYGLLISLVTIIVRIIWVFAGAYWNNIFKKKSGSGQSVSGNDDQTWKNVLIVAWTGTRGVISLATALAIPLTLQDGSAFPKRNSIIFLAFVVIFVTLVVQGLSLPLLVRLLGIKSQNYPDREEKELQLYLANNTLQFLEHEFPVPLDVKLREQLKKKYEEMIKDLTREISIHKKATRENEDSPVIPTDPIVNAQLEIKKFQRDLLIKLHKEGEFSDDALRQVERKMDVDELKLNLQLPKEEQQGTTI
ncbi:MAG: Na+/H+ antiporter [Chitinophagaceae bacterium]|nr:Na+/H+ antiporter [Chitinophagaceae bacterium]